MLSFPLRSRPNPLVSVIYEQLTRVRDSESTSTSSSISHKLNGLQDLYDCRPVDELLGRSLKLCNTVKDILLQTKGSIHDIQLVMRRRRRREIKLMGKVRKYFTSKKVVQKTIHKALKNVKRVETKRIFSSLNDHETKEMVSLIKEAKAVTSSIWALVSKLLHHKQIECGQVGKRDINEFERLKELELSVQNLEDGLECLFRCMIKARVSLLNALNH
ncbi:hypothetical protein V6Z11_A01G193600 [Gossypium hirsutum]